MSGRIFNISDDQLVEMIETPFDSEDVFQELLKRYPDLLTGDQNPTNSPRRWLLIRREMGIAAEEGRGDRWSLDHLFVDQDGIPTLVEVKRSSDTRIRREVVGQLLDYAANAVVHWSIDRVQAEYSENCTKDGIDPELRLTEFLLGSNAEEFWQKVKTNLQAGRIRLLFVADLIPAELRRIIEFLNAQMDPAEVLGVEIKHYVGQGLKTLVPRIVGQTAESEIRKTPGSQNARKPNLTPQQLQEKANQQGVGVIYESLVRKLLAQFDNVSTTLSNISFNARVADIKSATMITLTPEQSTASRGVRFTVYLDRLSLLSGLPEEEIANVLPECDKISTNWAGAYRQGFASSDSSFDRLIQLLIKKELLQVPTAEN